MRKNYYKINFIMYKNKNTQSILKEKGLKITPQRIAVLQILVNSENHPTAEWIIENIKKNHPGISTGTVYKILDTFVEYGIIKKVKTESGIMRYDAITKPHHHLYCKKSEKILDYEDPELDKIISDYFETKKIKGFKIEDITLQINGKFKT